MPTFVAIAQHTPTQCPGHNRQLFEEVRATMPKLPEIASKHNAKIESVLSLMASHKTVMVLDAPSYEAAQMVLYESGMGGWNTTELAQATPAEEAMKLSAQHFGL